MNFMYVVPVIVMATTTSRIKPTHGVGLRTNLGSTAGTGTDKGIDRIKGLAKNTAVLQVQHPVWASLGHLALGTDKGLEDGALGLGRHGLLVALLRRFAAALVLLVLLVLLALLVLAW